MILPVPFSFSGRIRRWPYFKSCLALALACLAPALLVYGAYPAIRAGSMAALVGTGTILVLSAVGVIWISLALQARRCRDIGWNPWFVVAPWIGLESAAPFVAHAVPALAAAVGLVNALTTLCVTLALTFWPSGDEAPPTRPRREPARMPSPAGPAPSVSLARATAPAMRTSFGQRGA